NAAVLAEAHAAVRNTTWGNSSGETANCLEAMRLNRSYNMKCIPTRGPYTNTAAPKPRYRPDIPSVCTTEVRVCQEFLYRAVSPRALSCTCIFCFTTSYIALKFRMMEWRRSGRCGGE